MNWKLLGKILFVAGTSALAWVNLPVAIFAVAATMITAIYDKADSLIELSFGPLKAKMERNVSESEKLISGLRLLALAQSRVVVAAASNTGRFATDDAWIFLATKDIEGGLRAVGATDSELKEVRSSLVTLTLRDLGATATNGSHLPTELGSEAVREWQEFRRTDKLSDPEFIEHWLSKYDVLGPEQQKILEAMRWIADNQDIRSEEQYLLTKMELKLERAQNMQTLARND